VRAFSKYVLLICALALAGAVAGCGGSTDDREDDAREIREKQAEFQAAVDAKDTEAFCEALAPSYIEELGGMEVCLRRYVTRKNLLFKAKNPDLAVRNIDFEENGEEATAYLANDGFIYYLKEDGEWYPTLFTR
jgi:hypothetical protein